MIEGSLTMMPIVQAAAEKYMKMNDDVIITIKGGTSASGIASFIEGNSDIVNASRPFNDTEFKKAFSSLEKSAEQLDEKENYFRLATAVYRLLPLDYLKSGTSPSYPNKEDGMVFYNEISRLLKLATASNKLEINKQITALNLLGGISFDLYIDALSKVDFTVNLALEDHNKKTDAEINADKYFKDAINATENTIRLESNPITIILCVSSWCSMI